MKTDKTSKIILKTQLKTGMTIYQNLKDKRRICDTRYIGEPSTDRFTPHKYTEADGKLLLKKPERDFVILNITDPHYSDYDKRFFYAFHAEETIKKLVKETDPDLITVTGDIVCGQSGVYSIDRFCDLLESFGIPWAPVFGNHDDETNCDLNYLGDRFLSCGHCLFRKGDPAMGAGNYILHIAEQRENGAFNYIESMLMMYHKDGHPNDKQKEWFSWAAEGIKKLSDNKAEVSIWMHIPLPEYQYAFNEAYDEAAGGWRASFEAAGEIHERICCERRDGLPYQRGFFDLIKASGNTKQVFCGHEHLNDFSLLYQGVRLTYLLKVGKGSGAGFGLNGCSVIRIGSNGIKRISHRAYNGIKTYNKADIIL